MSGHIVIEYLYRDGSNYKRFGCRMFANPSGVTEEDIQLAFANAFRRAQLFPDVLSFDPVVLGWEALFFEHHDAEADDVTLHELVSVESHPGDVEGAACLERLLCKLAELAARQA